MAILKKNDGLVLLLVCDGACECVICVIVLCDVWYFCLCVICVVCVCV